MTETNHDAPSLEDYRASVRSWLAQVEKPDVPLDLDGRFAVLRQWQRALFDAGWIGISWSREAGGQGLTPLHQMVFAEELARAGAPQPIGLIGLDVVGPSIDHYGSPEQKATLLPRLLSGDDIWCQGFSEPNSGSDLASLRTRARVEGDEFVIDGQKVWTSWAHKAQWCALLARTDPDAPKHKGISYILVDMSTPGVTVRPLVQMTGDEEFCEVFFEDVRVPVSNLVGELNAGWSIAQHTLGDERGSYTLRRCVEYEVAVEDAVQELRSHFAASGNRPDDHVCEQVGRAYTAVQGLEGQTRKTMERKMNGEGPSAYDSVDKLSLNETEQLMYTSITDLLGPLRNVTDARPLGLDAARWTKEHYYSRAASIYGGTSQVQRNIIAERLLGLPRG
ncbi:alkylation response protein AidB-like acyl-CoA dehydrogenase [Blastococcus colisei]|uniref:Alkylation response protein AidB-like acyl-CoA dehydrogenase n=1 Tax=Blastococcus colisei TaxID=1564162 RepID=A0A543PFF7_9ACTN|nr:acyl-CoA dehydrogenase family protein [Blastococcus colisei]TQN42813.1 alkylation response protein AidB-like acyl-CoA dehydrogenase [Blastococcus colisei]